MAKYQLGHTVKLAAGTAEYVWSLWANVNLWPAWDKGLESCVLEGDFIVGTSFALRPKGAPADLTTTLLEVEPYTRFKDRTEMYLGTIDVIHELQVLQDGLLLTHKIVADVYDDKVDVFENTLWAKWRTGLLNSVQNIASIVANKVAPIQAIPETGASSSEPAKATKAYALEYSTHLPLGSESFVWALWTDVANWPSWDKGLESCKIEGEFLPGKSFLLRPKGAPTDLTTILLEVEAEKYFKDRTLMPLGIIEVSHRLNVDNEYLCLTHKIDAQIYVEKVPAFEATLLTKWQAELPNSVHNIAEIVCLKSTSAQGSVISNADSTEVSGSSRKRTETSSSSSYFSSDERLKKQRTVHESELAKPKL